ncbi:MAG: amidohydrolase [Burkholderiales bacterium]
MNPLPKPALIPGVCLAALVSTCALAAPAADYVFRNGAVYTQDPAHPTAEALAVIGKKIAYVGTNQGAAAFVGAKTRVVDLGGRMVLPGFVDSHVHPTLAFLAAGADLQSDEVSEVLARTKAWADAHPQAKVVRGFGWRYTLFSTNGPDKRDLDRVFPDRPVMLVAIDGHSAWVNSKALEMAGITTAWPDPLPGVSFYQRDPTTGEPTGWVVEGPAEQEILAKLDPPTPASVMAAVADEMPRYAAAGITAVFDAGVAIMPTAPAFDGYRRLEREGRLPVRIVGSFYWNTPKVADPVAETVALRRAFQSELVQARTLKLTFDGGEAQHTAVMLQPYADRPGFVGEYALDPQRVAAAIMQAQSLGIDTHCHCYGDATTRTYLDAVAAARKAYPKSPSRHAASHVIFLADQDVPRFAELDVTMQVTPAWAMPDPTMKRTAEIVGENVAFNEFHRFRSVATKGGRVAFGSDWPASGYIYTYRPLDGIQVAVTRAIMPQYGHAQFAPVLPPEGERVTLDQALKASTIDAAHVLGLERRIGSLQAGKLADIVVLARDLHKIAPQEISTTKVELTMMNGKITHRDGL